jgi:hypothetical protein
LLNSNQTYFLSGRITNKQGVPLENLIVQAFDQDPVSAADKLGEAVTDAYGRYSIVFPEIAFHVEGKDRGGPDLYICVYDGGKLLARSPVYANAEQQSSIDLQIDYMPPNTRRTGVLTGRVRLDNGLPASRLPLYLLLLGYGGVRERIDETITDDQGNYTLSYNIPGAAGGLEIRTIDAEGGEIVLMKPLYDWKEKIEIDLTAPASVNPLATEYTRLSNAITPIVGAMANLANAREHEERQDLTFLSRNTGWDARLIALAASAERLRTAMKLELPQEAVYGMLRAGLPSDPKMLARVAPDAVEAALNKARDAGIILMSKDDIGKAKEQFAAAARRMRLAASVPGSNATYEDFLNASGLDHDAASRFANVFLEHEEGADALWENARRAGLDEKHIRRLQLQGKLAYLTGNSQAVTSHLLRLEISDPSQLVQHDFYRSETWQNLLAEMSGRETEKLEALIPPVYTGENTEARLAAYAEDMARKVRLSYPTQVISRLIETNELPIPGDRESTVRLLNAAAAEGFRLGATPVTTFFSTHRGLGEILDSKSFLQAKEQLKTLHRVYQMTPDNESMTVLLRMEMTSAHEIAVMDETRFTQQFNRLYLEIFGKQPTYGQARLVHRKARQVSATMHNLFAGVKNLEYSVPMHAVSPEPEVRERAREGLVRQFPTMESLFGSADYCECEHCRSVLSPAAYFVDLLQFIDPDDDTVWRNFLNDWEAAHGEKYTDRYKKPYDALIERRPDLPHIPLTCENTETPLPYIDLVNEILEYSAAHGSLTKDAAQNTGEVPSEELLAEPQHVIQEAYDRLNEARYPLTLPFDLWLETVRRFGEHFGIPLARMAAALRKDGALSVWDDGEALFAPEKPIDLARIFLESLGISPSEAALFTDPDPLAAWHALYGYASASEATTAAVDSATGERKDLNSAKTLARRLGVSYRELTEIIQTGFVNPHLVRLALLYKMGVSVSSARTYLNDRVLLDQDPERLPEDQRLRRSEAEAFRDRLMRLAEQYAMNAEQLEQELSEIPFDRILLLADPHAGCDFEMTTLQYANGAPADGIAFLRINWFVRLWRKLGWSIRETDRALTALIPAGAPIEEANLAKQPMKTALIYLSHLKALAGMGDFGKESVLKLTALWTDIPAWGSGSLYEQLFLSSSVLRSDRVFDDLTGRYLTPERIEAFARSETYTVRAENVAPADQITPEEVAAHPNLHVSYDPVRQVQVLRYTGVMTDDDKTAYLTLSSSPVWPVLLDAVQAKADAYPLIKGHLPALQGALTLTAEEIGQILRDAGLDAETAELSMANVSLLYRYSLLAGGLKLTIAELILLKRLTGLNPFTPLSPEPLEKLADDAPFTQTLRFIEIAGAIQDSGVSLAELDDWLHHRTGHSGEPTYLAWLRTIAEGIRAIRAEHAVPADPADLTDEILRQKLGLVLPKDAADQFMAMLNGKVEFTAAKQNVPEENRLDPEAFRGMSDIRSVSYNALKQEQTLVYRGVLLDARKHELTGGAASGLLVELLSDVQAQAFAFLHKYLEKQTAIEPASGFLDPGDYPLLFDDTLDAGETEQARFRKRRRKLAEAFLPYLQEKLIRQFVIRTMTAQTGADPAMTERLLTDARLLAGPGTLADVLADVGESGITASFYASPDGTGTPLLTTTIRGADTGLRHEDGVPIMPAAARSARLTGYLEVPVSGLYRFTIELDVKDASGELRFDHWPGQVFLQGTAAKDNDVLGTEPDRYLELKAGQLVRFALRLNGLNGGNARLLIQGESLPRGGLDRLALYPQQAMDHAARSVVRLVKSLSLLAKIGLNEREARYILTHAADFDGLDLNRLPAAADEADPAAARAMFRPILRLIDYARLKQEMAGGTDALIDVLEAAGAGDEDRAIALLSGLIRTDESEIRAARQVLFSAPDFTDTRSIGRLREALQITRRFGVPIDAAAEWVRILDSAAAPAQRSAIAQAMKDAVKSRYEPEAWQRLVRPINDALRQGRRDALAAYIMHREGFRSMEQLYEHFLIDPGMEPVVLTSRIRLASASVQLFIQRCLLNLEKNVHPSVINAKQWAWMKQYRVWEANRKIFLFPENWLEPEFRDDKTHLFAELEGALTEGDVSADLVEDAFLNYVRKLDELARLEILAAHLEEHADPLQRKLHVIGRTYGQPYTYYYRRYEHRTWTAWEPITAEVEGEHLAPVVWRNRLYLFWVTFLEKPKEPNPAASDSTKMTELTVGGNFARIQQKQVEIQLHWSEYLGGTWGERRSGETTLTSSVPHDFKPSGAFIHVSKKIEDGEERGVYIHLHGAVNKAFYLAGRNSIPVSEPHPVNGSSGQRPVNRYSASNPRAARLAGQKLLTVEFTHRETIDSSSVTTEVETPTIMSGGGAFTIVPCNHRIAAEIDDDEIGILMKPFFYQDDAHTFWIEPDVVERTVEEWQEWVTPAPKPDIVWIDPEMIDRLVMVPYIPDLDRIWDPRDPIIQDPIGPRIAEPIDWLINPGTGLVYDGTLIGQKGALPVRIVSTNTTPIDEIVTNADIALHASAGSGLAADQVLVADRAAIQEHGAAIDVQVGLSLIGGAGFNMSLAQGIADRLVHGPAGKSGFQFLGGGQ